MSGTILRRRDRTARPPRVEHYSSAVNNQYEFITDNLLNHSLFACVQDEARQSEDTCVDER